MSEVLGPRSGHPVYDGRVTVRAMAPLASSARAAVLVVVVGLAMACVPASTSTIPSESAGPSPASNTDSSRSASADAPLVGQTDTSWGRIWDEVPQAFPLYPGGFPAGGTSESVSAALTLEGVEPRDVATWMQMQLERAMFTTEGLNGPLEDGSFVLDAVGSGGCRIQVGAAPLGSLTSLIVRYGAECPGP